MGIGNHIENRFNGMFEDEAAGAHFCISCNLQICKQDFKTQEGSVRELVHVVKSLRGLKVTSASQTSTTYRGEVAGLQ